MNYYDELLSKIEMLFNDEKYEEAYNLISEELHAPYIPREIEDKLIYFFDEIKPYINKNKSLSDEDIIEYLKLDNEHQLIAVSILDKKNLRDYINICNEYLSNDGFKNAKVLLIDSLIRQEISDEIKYSDEGIDYSFIPKYIVPIEMTQGFKKGISLIEDKLMKDPSMAKMVKDLFFKECLFALPVNIEPSEVDSIIDKIIEYVTKAFNA